MLRFPLRDGQLQRKELSASPRITLNPSKRLGGPPLSAALKPLLRRVLTCMAVETISAMPSVDYGASGAGVHLRLLRKSPKNNRRVRDFAHLGH